MGSAARYREDEDWELYSDDGFVFKCKKRRLEPPATVPHSAFPKDADQFQDAAQKQRRERKRNILLKMKTRYLTELHHWDFLSAALRALEENALEYRRQQEQARLLPVDSVGKSVVDEVLLEVQAQEAIVHNISNLCDEAEAMCHKQEQQFKQTVFNLPIWASPVELMEFLCLCDH
ncbi:uncharacterized protein LOC114735073 [Neltuma alba]|uniref:uncharacterized protein LOC114735073 n=1 Tax=Neltuma alba TaxID=207710 RepID=UPI0010A3B4A6|nr:uncharacterized protein LOC114735073 [Prosopis alba]